MPKKKIDLSAALQTWTSLNDFLRSSKEEDCEKLLLLVQKPGFTERPKKRHRYLMRIFSRLNHLRLQRERAEFA